MMQITAAQVLNALQRHIGKDNGIHVRDLVRQVTGQTTDTEHLERKVREVITELRMELFLRATGAYELRVVSAA